MSLKAICAVGSIYCLAALGQVAQEKEGKEEIRNPLGKDKTAISQGANRFEANCAGCHGSQGKGGRGPRLSQIERVRNMSDKILFGIVKNGIPGTLMPPFSAADTEIWQLVSFVRSLNAAAIDQEAPGDAASGEAVFFGKANCSQCHMVRGRGGLIGPDLSNLGNSRSLEKIQESIADPSAFIGPGFNAVTAVTANGRRVRGVAKNNSSYSIQIMDAGGNFHSFLKSELQELTHHKASLMPPPSLSPSEMQDLVAFLSRQSTENTVDRPKMIEHGKEKNP